MIVFDVCGTLYISNTTFDFCIYRASGWKKFYLLFICSRFFSIINKISLLLYGTSLIPTRSIMLKSLKGVSKKQLQSESQRFVKEYLAIKKNVCVFNVLQSFPREQIVLASASIDCVIEAIAKELGIYKFHASKLQYNKLHLCQGLLETDLLGQKHFLFDNIEFIATDNRSDLELCLKAKRCLIITKRHNKAWWEQQNLTHANIVEI